MATALNNTASVNGEYNNIAFDPQSASVTAEIIDMSITKTASPLVWVGGELTYTVSVTNNDTALPLTNLVLTDTLDPILTAFVDGSVMINGTAAPATDVTYDETTGLLTVQVPDIAAGATTDVTFLVTQK